LVSLQKTWNPEGSGTTYLKYTERKKQNIFNNKGEFKTFPDKQKMREFIGGRYAL
jgi:hypothetical protein